MEGHRREEEAILTQEVEDHRSQEEEVRLFPEVEEAAEARHHLEGPTEHGCLSRTGNGTGSSSYQLHLSLKLSSVKRSTVPYRSGTG